MCLGIPGEVVSITDTTAVIDCWGTRRYVHVDRTAHAVAPGDFVIEHEGTIVRLISPEDVLDTLSLYEAVLAEA